MDQNFQDYSKLLIGFSNPLMRNLKNPIKRKKSRHYKRRSLFIQIPSSPQLQDQTNEFQNPASQNTKLFCINKPKQSLKRHSQSPIESSLQELQEQEQGNIGVFIKDFQVNSSIRPEKLSFDCTVLTVKRNQRDQPESAKKKVNPNTKGSFKVISGEPRRAKFRIPVLNPKQKPNFKQGNPEVAIKAYIRRLSEELQDFHMTKQKKKKPVLERLKKKFLR